MKLKSFISLLLCSVLMVPFVSLGDCDFSKGITPGLNGTFVYSETCHKKVGQVVQDNKNLTQANSDLTKAISLKDLAIQTSDKRATLWNNTAENLESRLQKVDTMEKHNEWIFFGLGVLATGASVWLAAKAIGH